MVNEVRKFARERAKESGLPGTGRCYNDKRKKVRHVQVGLADGGRSRHPSETFEKDMRILEDLAKEMSEKFQVEVAACIISHGCPCCAGRSLGVKFTLPL